MSAPPTKTIRIAITQPGRFVSSLGNAAPLYRVQALDFTPPAGPTTKRLIKFLSPPLDQASQPLAGDVVEIMPWGTLLPNGEKLAEERASLPSSTRPMIRRRARS